MAAGLVEIGTRAVTEGYNRQVRTASWLGERAHLVPDFHKVRIFVFCLQPIFLIYFQGFCLEAASHKLEVQLELCERHSGTGEDLQARSRGGGWARPVVHPGRVRPYPSPQEAVEGSGLSMGG